MLLPTSLVMLVSILWMFLISKAMSSITEEKLTCLYPSPSSIQPCFCHMQAEFEAEDVKCSEDVKCDDDYDNAWAEKRTFSGTFYKTVTCSFEDTSSFSKAAQAFYYDNLIPVLKISGRKHEGDFFLKKEDLGRLNVSSLAIEIAHLNDQKIFEDGAFKGSEDSIYFLSVKIKNSHKVQYNAGHVGLGYIKQICSSLETLSAHGVSYIQPEDFQGCSKLSYLRLMNSNMAVIGPDSFRHLPNLQNFDFSSHSKFWIKTGAFKNLKKLENVHFYAASNLGEEYPILSPEHYNFNKTVISSGAFKSLPSLRVLGFSCTDMYRCKENPMGVDLFEEMPFLGLDQLQEFVVLKGQQTSLPRLFDNASKLWKFLFKPGLKTINENAFEGLSNVTEIFLADNKLTFLNRAFSGLPHLTKIDLSNNGIVSFNNSLQELPSLKKVDISGNTGFTSLNTVKDDLGSHMDDNDHGDHNIFQIIMNDIPLDCGCDMKWLARDQAMLRYFAPEAKCVDGVLLKTVSKASKNSL